MFFMFAILTMMKTCVLLILRICHPHQFHHLSFSLVTILTMPHVCNVMAPDLPELLVGRSVTLHGQTVPRQGAQLHLSHGSGLDQGPLPIGSMGLLYMVTFTINIPHLC
jgi:hypothetical protein